MQYTGMILIDGWLEYQGDEDEWASGFFILTIGSGLQCFEHEPDEQVSLQPLETLPLEQISCAVRAAWSELPLVWPQTETASSGSLHGVPGTRCSPTAEDPRPEF